MLKENNTINFPVVKFTNDKSGKCYIIIPGGFNREDDASTAYNRSELFVPLTDFMEEARQSGYVQLESLQRKAVEKIYRGVTSLDYTEVKSYVVTAQPETRYKITVKSNVFNTSFDSLDPELRQTLEQMDPDKLSKLLSQALHLKDQVGEV